MKTMKILFEQTMLVSTGILFLIGAEGVACHFLGTEFQLDWYQPIAILLTGFLCSIPTLMFWDENLGGKRFWCYVGLHCVIEFGIVSLAGWVFRWYTTIGGYLVMVLFYFFVYGFAWLSSLWMEKVDEDRINQALKEIQDEE